MRKLRQIEGEGYHSPLPSKPFAEGRKAIITNKFNFSDIENPFAKYDMTLETIKMEKHLKYL